MVVIIVTYSSIFSAGERRDGMTLSTYCKQRIMQLYFVHFCPHRKFTKTTFHGRDFDFNQLANLQALSRVTVLLL